MNDQSHIPTAQSGPSAVTKHFVEFLSPGTFVSETSVLPIASWHVGEAEQLAYSVKERHGSTPYGFRFITRSRGTDDLDSKVTDTSGIYYLGGKLRTLAEVEADNLPNEEILRSNMRCNGYGTVIENNNSWKFTAPFTERDTLLDWTP